MPEWRATLRALVLVIEADDNEDYVLALALRVGSSSLLLYTWVS
jgi:hypothetical protein